MRPSSKFDRGSSKFNKTAYETVYLEKRKDIFVLIKHSSISQGRPSYAFYGKPTLGYHQRYLHSTLYDLTNTCFVLLRVAAIRYELTVYKYNRMGQPTSAAQG